MTASVCGRDFAGRGSPPAGKGHPWRSGRVRRTRSARRSTARGTNFALFSEVAERVELCLFDDDAAPRPASSCPRSTRSSGTATCRRRSRASATATGCTARTTRRRAALQPEQAAARPVRQGDRRRDRLGPGAVRLRLRRPGLAQRRRLGAAHDARRRDQPVLRLGRRPPAATSRTTRRSSTRRTSRGSPSCTRTSRRSCAAPTPASPTRRSSST